MNAEKIRILYVVPQLIVGGSEIQLLETIKYLDKQRYEPYVCSLSGDRMTLLEDFRAAGAIVLPFHKNYRFDLSIVWRLRRFLRRRRIWIVHSYLNNTWARIAGVLAGTPLIIASERSVDSWWKSRLHLIIDSLLALFTDHILVNSAAVQRYYADNLLWLRPDKIRVIYNGINRGKYVSGASPAAMKAALGIGQFAHAVGIIATLKEVKDHWTFLRAAKLVLEQGHDAVFLVVGDGPLRERLQQYAAELGIAARVRFLGLRSDVPQLLAAIDISVLCSIQEGFSNAILEAMAAGKPVVATDVGGNAEAIVDGETGYIVPPGEAPRLAEAIAALLADGEKIRRFGENGSRRVLERFLLEERFDELHRLYVSSLQKKGKPVKEPIYG